MRLVEKNRIQIRDSVRGRLLCHEIYNTLVLLQRALIEGAPRRSRRPLRIRAENLLYEICRLWMERGRRL